VSARAGEGGRREREIETKRDKKTEMRNVKASVREEVKKRRRK
jgi:hypothetical protein